MARPKGLPKSGGRAKGTRNKKTQEVLEVAARAGITPLEVMIEAMMHLRGAGDLVAAGDMASKAAPYVHARLSAIEHSGEIATQYVAQMPVVSSDADAWSTQHAPKPRLQ